MIGIVALLSLLATGLGLGWAVKAMDQVVRDRKRKTYRVAFPADLDPERVTAWLRSISGTLRNSGISKHLSGAPSIALELWATNQGIVHRVKIPWQYEAYIRPKLESLIPGIRLTPEEEPPVRVWVHAVEAGLKAGHRTLRISNPSDVSTSILANFGAMQADETLMMQWVIAPAVPQHKPIHGTAQSKEMSWKALLLGGDATRDEVQDRREKLEEPNMLGVLRVAAVASTQTRAQFMVRGVMSSLDSSRGPSTHFYRRIVTATALKERIDRCASPLTFPAQLSAPELTACLGWPLGNPLVAGLPGAVSRYLPAQAAVPSTGRVLGLSTFPGRERPVAVGYTEARKHTWVLGGTGSGKSTLLANMLKQDMEAGYGAVLIESKGDLFKQALDYVPPGRRDDVIVFDVNDTQMPIGFNILQQGNPATIVDELNMLFNTLFKDHPSLWMQELMYYSLQTLIMDKRATFIDLPALVSPASDELAWRDNLIRNVKDAQVKRFWQDFDNQSRTRQDQKAEPLLSRVWPMSRTKLMNIVGQSESSFYMEDVVKQNKILLVNLSGIERGAATLMGTLLVNSLWQAVKTHHSEKGIFLYADEFQHMMNIPVDFQEMLVESRSMGLGMVLAHQYIDQLTAPNMEEAILSNAKTKVVFQLGATDARTVANNFGPMIAQSDLQNLARFEAVAQVSTGEGVSQPLTLNTLVPARGYGQAAQIKYESRGKYGRNSNEVQDEILARRTAEKSPGIGRPRPKVEGWGL